MDLKVWRFKSTPPYIFKNWSWWGRQIKIFFNVLLTVHLSIFISVTWCTKFLFYKKKLFHACTCFEHMCSSSGGQNCIIQPLVSSHLYVWWYQDSIPDRQSRSSVAITTVSQSVRSQCKILGPWPLLSLATTRWPRNCKCAQTSANPVRQFELPKYMYVFICI